MGKHEKMAELQARLAACQVNRDFARDRIREIRKAIRKERLHIGRKGKRERTITVDAL
jgi:hypothetical protein